jgi:hypothetical protein
MERVQLIIHQGKKILYSDFSNLQFVEDVSEVMKEVTKYVHVQPLNSIYSLINVEGTHFNNDIKSMFAEVAKSNKPFVKVSAIVGISGLKQIMYKAIMKLSGRNDECFSTIEQAKDWLVKQN